MAGLTLDASPLIAWERRDRVVRALLAEIAEETHVELHVPAPVIAEVWRGGAASAELARLLKTCFLDETDEAIARHAGELLGACDSNATIDALVVAHAARHGTPVLTGDADDIEPLARRAGVEVVAL